LRGRVHIVEEEDEGRPALQTPWWQVPLLTNDLSDLRALTVDLALDVEQGVDPLHHFQSDRRFDGWLLAPRFSARVRLDVGYRKKGPPCMDPAGARRTPGLLRISQINPLQEAAALEPFSLTKIVLSHHAKRLLSVGRYEHEKGRRRP
jgi:hypothetical protein